MSVILFLDIAISCHYTRISNLCSETEDSCFISGDIRSEIESARFLSFLFLSYFSSISQFPSFNSRGNR